MIRLPGTVAFAAATLVLLIAAVLMAARGIHYRDPLRLAFALILLGFAGAMAYETFAYATRLDPTISLITATEFITHPGAYLAIFLPLMLLAGALAAHFTYLGGIVRWWVLLGGGAAYLLGGIVTWRSGWLP